MRSLQEALKLTNPGQIVREINERKELGLNSNGTMYPEKILKEISALSARISELRKKK